ncbi:MAG: minor capsid protein [Bifidobacteriaceae bacterium]|nr:minor capsid protein [Bifidobacteriaceae bacterium]
MTKRTAKKHDNYWQKRTEDIMRYVDSTDINVFEELQKIYIEHSAEVQRDLFAFVTKYADDNKISYSEALQRLRGVDLSDYQANAEKYRKQAEKDPELLKRLNEQYVSSKVTRFDALNLEMTYKICVMQGIIEKSFENYLKSTAKYAYRKIMGGNSGTLNEPALKELIDTPFNGRNYSQQVWGNTDDLARDLRDVLKRGFIRGDDVRSMAAELAKKYNVARSRAQTLIRTDGTAIVNRSAIKRYEESGLEFYRISVHLDNRTSETCRAIAKENKLYRIDEFETGITAPPFHYNCRSAVIPDEEELNKKSEINKT